MVVMCSSVPGRVLRFLPAWRKCITMTIRLTRTIGFEDTNTIGYYTHQGIELPVIAMDIQPVILHQGTCRGWGRTRKAQRPREHPAGYGPRLPALIGERAGMQRTSRRLGQD